MRANVVVEELSIIEGPGTTKLLEIILELNLISSLNSSGIYNGRGVKTLFTVVAPGAYEPFTVNVWIHELKREEGAPTTILTFNGSFQGTEVNGSYCYRRHIGYFCEK